jgi:hypothetical protein
MRPRLTESIPIIDPISLIDDHSRTMFHGKGADGRFTRRPNQRRVLCRSAARFSQQPSP